MVTEWFVFFGGLSFAAAIVSLLYTVFVYSKRTRAKRILSSIQLCTIGLFAATFLAFLPVYFTHYDFGDSRAYVRPVLLAIHNALRIFILDGDFDIVVNAVEGLQDQLRVAFSVYMAFLYVIAPFMTFSNVLSLFDNIKGEFLFRLRSRRNHYIMSELNDKSLALARSICEEARKSGEKIDIVFADVFEDNNDDTYELILEARSINAICLKKDITHLNIFSKKGEVQLFLIGEDESENVSKAIKITEELDRRNKKQNVKIFAFSRNSSASYIIDSARYNNLLEAASRRDFGENTFKLRRINEIQQHVWKTVPQMGVFDIAQKHGNRLSVLIVGLGEYGTEFLKMLIWYCQFEGYTLEINVIDKINRKAPGSDSRMKGVDSVINRHQPELLAKNRCTEDGEALYDLEIYSGIDITTDDFSEMLLYEGNDAEKRKCAERLRRTNLAIVTLGDDDVNIEVSVYLRGLFDRINGVRAKRDIRLEDEAVEIYSIVYDDQKAGILHGGSGTQSDTEFLVNHKDVPYHIHFTGAMSSRFRYDYIYDRELEQKAYGQHTGWADIEERIHLEWLAAKDKDNLDSRDWDYDYVKSEDGKKDSKKSYEKYEYYRMSSMAKELAKMEISRNERLRAATTCLESGKQTCECENCVRRKRSEHMRWNAYTRVIGYSYGKGMRADRARLHDDLRPWNELTLFEKLKD